MSHLPQRKEKNCLNCGTEILGRYCHQCGQENLEPKESFWHLITHFFNDFTHFDGKFFSTLKLLVLKPGYLTAEYTKGRRASYLHPIRMYVFTSAIFFVIFFWLFHVDKANLINVKLTGKDSVSWIKSQEYLLKNANTHQDSIEIIQGIERVKAGLSIDPLKKKSNVRFSFDTTSFASIGQYDSAQKKLPEKDRDGWFVRRMRMRSITIAETYHGDASAFWYDVLNNFIHQFPKLFFISLPIVAMILKLLYVRRKQYYYADHAIFSIHLYIFWYILLLFIFGIGKLGEYFPSVIWQWLKGILSLYLLYYVYKAMRNFYKQRRMKTIVKYFILGVLCFITILILFGLFFSYSVLES